LTTSQGQQPFAELRDTKRLGGRLKDFVVMKYIDNLIDWGDQLFRRDTLERIPGVERDWGYWLIVGVAILVALVGCAIAVSTIE